MIEITLNGKAHRVTPDSTVQDLIRDLGLTERRIAVEHNQEILPKSEHASTRLSPADQLEIVHAIGGG